MSKILDSLSTTTSQVGNATKGIFGKKDAAQAAADSVAAAAKPGVGSMTLRIISKPFRMVFNGVVSVATVPLKIADSLGGKAISGYGNAFAKNPKTMLLATGAVAAVGVGHMMNKRSERAAIDNMNQLEMAQAQQASMAQAQANTVTPAEYAAMEARMKQGGQNGGFAAGIQAERAAAASATPTV